MKLSVLERLLLGMYLPKDGKLADFLVLLDLRRAIGFSEEEHKALNLRYEGEGQEQRTYWNPIDDKDVEIGERALGIIREALKPIAENPHGVNQENFSLFQKFYIEEPVVPAEIPNGQPT